MPRPRFQRASLMTIVPSAFSRTDLSLVSMSFGSSCMCICPVLGFPASGSFYRPLRKRLSPPIKLLRRFLRGLFWQGGASRVSPPPVATNIIVPSMVVKGGRVLNARLPVFAENHAGEFNALLVVAHGALDLMVSALFRQQSTPRAPGVTLPNAAWLFTKIHKRFTAICRA